MYAEYVCEHEVMSVSMLQWRLGKWSRTDAEHDSAVLSHSQERDFVKD